MARKAFTIKVTRARVTTSRFTTADMFEFGDTLTLSIKNRISRAQTIDDTDAKPLTEKYRKWKAKITPFLTRNLYLIGNMMRSIRVTKINQNGFTIFFTERKEAQKMGWNMRHSPQWGISPNDAKKLQAAIGNKKLFKTEQQKAWEKSA